MVRRAQYKRHDRIIPLVARHCVSLSELCLSSIRDDRVESTSVWTPLYPPKLQEVVDEGTNVLRFIEYAVSATLMQIAIALIQRLVLCGRIVIIYSSVLESLSTLLVLRNYGRK